MVHMPDVVTVAAAFVFAAWAFAIHLCRDGLADGPDDAGTAWD